MNLHFRNPSNDSSMLNPSNDSSMLNLPHEIKFSGYTRDGWTFEETKIYETAMMDFVDTNSMPFFEHVVGLMPWHTIESIKNHGQILMEDMRLIKLSNGNFEDIIEQDSEMEVKETRKMTCKPKKKGIPWTVDEHMLFLRGLQEEGKGEWKTISKKYLPSKTPTQIASHAQKFEKRMHTKTPIEKRRTSINDIKLCPGSSFSLNFQSNQPNFLLNTQDGFKPNQITFPLNYEGFESNQLNYILNSQDFQPNQVTFPLDSQIFETNQIDFTLNVQQQNQIQIDFPLNFENSLNIETNQFENVTSRDVVNNNYESY